jgi:hypothetical protein
VIFITAYPERFLAGTRPEPAFLLSKPSRASALSAMVSQVLFFESQHAQIAALSRGRVETHEASQARLLSPDQSGSKAFDGLLGQRSDNPIDLAATLSGHRNSQIWCIRQNNPDRPAVSDLDICRRNYECLGHLSTFPR